MMVRPPDAPEVWHEVNAVPLFDECGNLAEIAVTFIAVTCPSPSAGLGAPSRLTGRTRSTLAACVDFSE
jgi:hypothetical protein